MKNKSYLYGLLLADGNISLSSRNRGRVSLEISVRDKDIVYKLSNIYKDSLIRTRIRNTNFKSDYRSILFNNHHRYFRDELIAMGFPVGVKHDIANVPIVDYSKRDFWRGYIDGDGSLGFTNKGVPFVSLTISSEKIKDEYEKLLINKFDIHKKINRNKRDNIYNISVMNEDAQKLCKYLYSDDDDLYIDRKLSLAKSILGWERTVPARPNRAWWDLEQDEFILNNSIEASMKKLKRTESSIKNRLFRLKSKQ